MSAHAWIEKHRLLGEASCQEAYLTSHEPPSCTPLLGTENVITVIGMFTLLVDELVPRSGYLMICVRPW